MLNLKGAASARRHWRSIMAVQAENARSIDVSATSAELSQMRPGADALLNDLERDGIAVVPNYWTANECNSARREIDRIIDAYPEAVRVFSGGSDKRMFGVEMVSPALAKFYDDKFLKGIGEACGALELYNFFTLGARIDAVPENNGSGDGWHRDAFGFQYKSILYLSDVGSENGPFEYLPGSHKLWRVISDTAVGQMPAAPQSRFDPKDVERLVKRLRVRQRTYAGSQGTLLLVNTAGVHRGAPLFSGTRYALTNYFYHPYQLGTSLIEKFAPLVPGVAERVTDMLAHRESQRRYA